MIYVTTGTHQAPFDRLVKAMDTYAMTTPEEIIIQPGTSKVEIHKAKVVPFMAWEESNEYVKTARILVCHAGGGTLMDAIMANTPMIIWPRLAEYHEHTNNHQLQIADSLRKQGRATVVGSAEELFEALRKNEVPNPMREQSADTLTNAIRASLDLLRRGKLGTS